MKSAIAGFVNYHIYITKIPVCSLLMYKKLLECGPVPNSTVARMDHLQLWRCFDSFTPKTHL